MHSLTYTQKKLPAECRQQRCICLYTYIFSPHANSSGQTSGQKVKNAYTIYTLNIHFLFSKSAYTIYIPETTFPASSSHSNGPVTTLTSLNQPAAGRNRPNHYSSTPHAYPHFAGSRIKYTTQQSQATSATTTTRQ